MPAIYLTAPQLQFQAYLMDEWGNATGMVELHCATIEQAIERARGDQYPVELWQGPNRIARFTPDEWRPFER